MIARADTPVEALSALLADRMRASLVPADVRDRLLDVALLLSVEADATSSPVVRACVEELRAVCGLSAGATHEAARRAEMPPLARRRGR